MDSLANEDIFADQNEESTQYDEERDISTQTGDPENLEDSANQTKSCQTITFTSTQSQTIIPSSTMTTSLATLANRFLHSSYWFLALGLVFSSHSLPNLKHTTIMRQTITMVTARRILSLLLHMSSLMLADVGKPSLVVRECTVGQAVRDIRDLDRWLFNSVREVVMMAKDEGVTIVVEVLEQIMEEQKLMMEDSLNMNSKTFMKM